MANSQPLMLGVLRMWTRILKCRPGARMRKPFAAAPSNGARWRRRRAFIRRSRINGHGLCATADAAEVSRTESIGIFEPEAQGAVDADMSGPDQCDPNSSWH